MRCILYGHLIAVNGNPGFSSSMGDMGNILSVLYELHRKLINIT